MTSENFCQSFVEAPVPYIAGVLAAPSHGYEDGIVVVVVEDDQVLGDLTLLMCDMTHWSVT